MSTNVLAAPAFRELLLTTGGFLRLLVRALRSVPRCRSAQVWEHFEQIGVDSWHIVMITSFFTGGVLAMQSAAAFLDLDMRGAISFIPNIVCKSMVLELGPVFTALILAGRAGSGIAAQLSSMTVSRQVDALRALAIDPIGYLVTPRLIAFLLCLPLLTVLANFAGLFGGFMYATLKLGMGAGSYLQATAESLLLKDVLMSELKTLVWAGLIVVIGCLHGLRARGGIVGVGSATRNTVVHAMTLILISDFFLTRVFRIALSHFFS